MGPQVFIIMGVAATGKTTFGKALAKTANGNFFDGDDFHPKSNRLKMAAGQPLNDDDRQGWLETLSGLIAERATESQPSFIACSALKESYRSILRSKYPPLAFIFLTADPEILRQRISDRFETGEHFMPPSLLKSQLDSLETPDYALTLNVSEPIHELVSTVLAKYPHLDC
ncbi:MAG: gluconokinase [Akkermansiaceae bacterium]